ncbi:MAG TPA: phosphotransferase family protein [Candidatus Baltobacteraceae bacterium]|nr:phosphotransferase family protein [Candidatus Baltobacteraceae bacterium]
MNDDDPEVIDVRPEERLELAELEPYLRAQLNEPSGAFSLRQFGGGHANLTYLVRFGEREYVLRRPPLGPIPAHAHDMRREHVVLSKLYTAYPLAPRSYLLCTDHAIVGSDFVVEERKHGIAIRRDLPERFVGDRAFCARLGAAVIDALADLHRVDVTAVGLRDLGRPEGYVLRQVDGWSARWEAARTAESADATWIAAWLRERLPASPAATIVHNDFKLDNMLLDAADPSRVSAVLDWDMCTYGDPLMDLGYLLALWPEPNDPPAFRLGAMPTWHEGFPSRDAAIARYAERTGFNVERVAWYVIFNVFRFAAILQQIYKRYDAGQTHDERFRGFGKQANALIATATALAKREAP